MYIFISQIFLYLYFIFINRNRRLSTKFNEELNEVEGLRREIENMTNTFEHIDPKLIIPVVEKFVIY